MENPVQITTKNPKKVEAGKKLAEYNRQQREKLKEFEERERREAFLKKNQPLEPELESKTSPAPTSSPTQSSKPFETPVEVYGVAGLIILGGIAYYIFTREKPKKKRNISSSPQSPPSTPVTPVTKVVQKIIKNTTTNSSKFEME